MVKSHLLKKRQPYGSCNGSYVTIAVFSTLLEGVENAIFPSVLQLPKATHTYATGDHRELIYCKV